MKPILFKLFGSSVYSYPLLMGIGWGMAYNLSITHWRKLGLPDKDLNLFAIFSFLFGWIGAKVFFLIFSTPDKVFYYGKEINFWLGGGFVFYGGFVFALGFALLFFKLRPKLRLLDMAALIPGVCFGHALGRLGCLLAGCCYGSQTDSVLSIYMDGHDRHPVQIYEGLGLVVLYLITTKLVKKEMLKETLMTYLFGYSLLRFTVEFLRGDEIRGLYYGLSTSQWVSLALALFAVGFSLKLKKEVN